ncbi:hypothetical protein AB0H58_16725 [Nocardia neocaledoniensis]|uniref:hypothetical protein n=1 Tax=Nocardia neocaledoniensis TaxID=236511 RepID=UPI0033ECA324
MPLTADPYESGLGAAPTAHQANESDYPPRKQDFSMHDSNTSRDSAIRSFALLLQTLGAIVHPAEIGAARLMIGLDAEYGMVGQLIQLLADRLDVLRELNAVEAWEVVAAWFDAELAAVAAGESVAEAKFQSIARQYTGAECIHCGRQFAPEDDMVPSDYTPAGREVYSCGPCIHGPAELDELSIQRVYNQVLKGGEQ